MAREKVISVRFGEDELATVDARAQDAGVERSAYLRCCATGVRVVGIDRDLLRQVLLELKREGSNLNQLAHACNRDAAMVSGREISETMAACRAAIGAVTEFVAKEGRR